MAQLNPIKVMMEEMEKTCGKGVRIELQKKMPDGSVVPATESHMDAVDVHSSIASTAGSLQNMTHEQKTEWAISTKNYANALYENKLYKQAVIKYVECLTATRFGAAMSKVAVEAGQPKLKGTQAQAQAKPQTQTQTQTQGQPKAPIATASPLTKLGEAELGYNPNDADPESEANNVDEVVIPVLNNLIACSMRMFEYKKAKLFCEQLLKYAPDNYKGTYRLAQCHVRSGEYEQAVAVLDNLLQVYLRLQAAEAEAGVDIAGRGSGTAAGGESANPATSEMDLSEAAVDDAEDGEAGAESDAGEVLEMAPDRTFEVPAAKPTARTLTTVDYIRGLRRRALAGIEQERRNCRRQQQAMKTAFASKPPPAAAAATAEAEPLPGAAGGGTDSGLRSRTRAGAASETSSPSPASKAPATSGTQGKRAPSPLQDVAVVLLYLSVLMCLSAIIVRGIVHYLL